MIPNEKKDIRVLTMIMIDSGGDSVLSGGRGFLCGGDDGDTK